jgi:flagellar assembly protein FliH
MLQAGTSEVDATIETRWKRVLESIGAEPQEWLTT